MKTVTTLIGLVLLSGVTLASSTLNLALNRGNSYTVYLDGQQYQTSSTIQFQDLFPGRHTLSVIKKDNYNNTSIYNGFVDLEDNQELYGTISNGNLSISTENNSHSNGEAYSGNDYTDHNQYDNFNYDSGTNHYNHHQYGMSQHVFNELHRDFSCATDSRKERLLIQKAQRNGISTNQAKHLLREFSFDSHRLSAAKKLTPSIIDRENYWVVGGVFDFTSNKKSFLRHINQNNYNPNGGYNGNCSPRPNRPNSYGMNQQSFQILKRTIGNESFDDNKKEQVLTAVRHGRISAQQMTTLLREFTFDSNRLETAKAVIPYISDKRNYWMAGETFTFSSNKKEFLSALN